MRRRRLKKKKQEEKKKKETYRQVTNKERTNEIRKKKNLCVERQTKVNKLALKKVEQGKKRSS